MEIIQFLLPLARIQQGPMHTHIHTHTNTHMLASHSWVHYSFLCAYIAIYPLNFASKNALPAPVHLFLCPRSQMTFSWAGTGSTQEVLFGAFRISLLKPFPVLLFTQLGHWLLALHTLWSPHQPLLSSGLCYCAAEILTLPFLWGGGEAMTGMVLEGESPELSARALEALNRLGIVLLQIGKLRPRGGGTK